MNLARRIEAAERRVRALERRSREAGDCTTCKGRGWGTVEVVDEAGVVIRPAPACPSCGTTARPTKRVVGTAWDEV